jgi:hypothetical protein
MTDVLMQKYSPVWGFGSFLPVMFIVVGILSLGFLPFMQGSGRAPAWLWSGVVVMAVQALGMAYGISRFGHVTTVNIAYNSRGLWSIAMIWAFGHWFGNTERERGTPTMLLRSAGACLLVTAIFIASS